MTPNLRAIWVADDSRIERDRVVAGLPAEHIVQTFEDGADVIEALAGGAEPPEMMITDLVMPGVAGIELIQFLRADARSNGVGIIVLTSSGPDDLEAAFLAGADDFVRKPVDKSELQARMARILERNDARTAAERDFSRRSMAELERSERAHRRAEEERRRGDESEAQTRLAEMFMGILGHDLRNPLNSIVMANAILQRSDLSDDRRELATRRISSSVARMTELIGRMLDMTRSRLAGGISIAVEQHDTRSVCDLVIDELSAANPERPITHTGSGNAWMEIDPSRIAQVLSNLIGNAVEHGDPTRPIDVVTTGDAAEVRVEISNHGDDIPPLILPTIFEPFRRAAAGVVGATGSMGLGLYISKQLVEAHGGSIEVKSGQGKTSFTIRLPRVT